MIPLTPILAVVVTYNRPELLRQCLACLFAQTHPCEILVVDNASTDGTGEAMRALAAEGKILYRNTGKNLGGAGGFSFGMRYAAEEGYKYAWIMDDDSLPKPDALELLVKAGERLGGPERYGFVSSRVLWTDGTDCVMNRQKRLKKQIPELQEEGLLLIKQATFVSLLIPTAHIWKYGLPLTPYFIWNDDIEYTHRLILRNRLPGYLVEQSHVIHAMDHNHGSNIAKDKVSRVDRYRLMYRNECNTYRQEGLKGIAFFLAHIGRDFFYILFLAKDHRKERFQALFRGVTEGIRFHPEIEYPQS